MTTTLMGKVTHHVHELKTARRDKNCAAIMQESLLDLKRHAWVDL